MPQKRELTCARREQNRAAQRAYRQRRREARERVREAQNTAAAVAAPASRDLVAALPDPRTNSLRSPGSTLRLAALANARALGLDLDAVVARPGCPSPFYDPAAAMAAHADALAAVLRAGGGGNGGAQIPEHLRPTLPQVMFPHPVCIDLLPLPVLRSRLIMLGVSSSGSSSSSSAVVDEFKRDIYYGHDALVCWPAVGSGQPWDANCWEAAPWFLRKWGVFVGGEAGDLWVNSAMWREVRGRVEEDQEDLDDGLVPPTAQVT